MFGANFYVYKKEVQKMSDLIELKLITREDAECLHKLQIEAFMPLYEKYQDDATSPAKESLETITKKIVMIIRISILFCLMVRKLEL